MNIGILTLPFNSNYGGILQGYALQTAIEHLGHSAFHINKPAHHSLPFCLRPIAYAKRLVEQKIQGKNKRILFEEYQNAIVVHTNEFVRQYLHLWKDGRTESVTEEDFDALVVGSDQVWRKAFWPDVRQAFLSFTSSWNVKRVAYAASFGLDSWQYDEKLTRECAQLLSQFDAVSTREASGVELCRNYLGCEAQQMPDPTLLLQQEDYAQLIKGEQSHPNSLFVYLLEKNEMSDKIIDAVARRTSLKPYQLIASDDIRLSVAECVRPRVETWLKGFADASMVLTNSFHGCVFSILFGKPFIVVGKTVAGITRISSLLEQFGFQNNMIDEKAPDLDHLMINETDTPLVKERLSQLRQQGYAFLNASLS